MKIAPILIATALLLMPAGSAMDAMAQSGSPTLSCFRSSNIVFATINDGSATSVTAEACGAGASSCVTSSGTTNAQANTGYDFNPGTCYFTWVDSGGSHSASETSN